MSEKTLSGALLEIAGLIGVRGDSGKFLRLGQRAFELERRVAALEAERDELKARLEAMKNAATITIVAIANHTTTEESEAKLDNVREMLEIAIAAAQEEE